MPQGRVKSKKHRDYHAEQCTVCKHPQRLEIERQYNKLFPTREVAEEFGLSHDALTRHARTYGMDQSRLIDTLRLKRSLIGRALDLIDTEKIQISPQLMVELIKEVNRVTGAHKEPARNPLDLARSSYAEILNKLALSEEDAAQIVAEQFGVDPAMLMSENVH